MKRLLRPLSLTVVLAVMASMMTFSAFSATKNDNSVGADIDMVSSGTYTNSSESYKTYSGTDLGATYSPASTTFKVWAPSATNVQLKLYKTGSDSEAGAGVIGTYDMEKDASTGVWSVVQSGDLKNVYYTYLVSVNGKVNETRDVYANAAGVNGKRSMVVDLSSTDPDGWENDEHILFDEQTDAMVWEFSVRDFSLNSTSGVDADKRGKFLGVAQHGTTLNGAGIVKTGIDYLIENQVNCVQIMPMYDFGSVDETKGGQNWGYDPYNYNVPEGSFSSDPYNGEVRIKELKTMIKALHDAGISVIMDVVYNHVYSTDDTPFEMTVPGYYFRMDGSKFLNGSGCGNVTASDKTMYRKFMIDSLKYWANEYHIDGFRFDLMGCHDITTMNTIRSELDKIDKRIIMYGEPWMADWSGGNGISNSQAAILDNVGKLDARVGCFDDKSRSALKGDVNDASKGFIQGSTSNDWGVKSGCMAGVGSMWGINKAPSQIVHYLSCHDNLPLWDKILKSYNSTDYDGTNGEYINANKLAAVFTFTSQGIPFVQAGEEFARTKYGDHNSYQSGDEVNKMDWTRVVKYSNLVNYYKGLRMIRKVYSPFSDGSSTSVSSSYFVDAPAGVVAYTMQNKTKNAANEWGMTAVILNTNSSDKSVTLKATTALPTQWATIVNGTSAGLKNLGTVSGSTISVPARSALVLVDKASFDEKNIQEPGVSKPTVPTQPTTTSPKEAVITYHMQDIKGYENGTVTEKTTDSHLTKTFEPVSDDYFITYARVITGNQEVTDTVYNLDTNTVDMDVKGDVDITVIAVPRSTGEVRLYGDINGDGQINVTDATAVQKASARLVQLDEVQSKVADVDGNGKVNIQDATAIQKRAVKSISTFPVGDVFSGGETPTYTVPTFVTATEPTTESQTVTTTSTVATTTEPTTPLPSGTIKFVSNIDLGNERWAAYFWNDTETTWVDVASDGTVEVPSGAENVIFVRFNGESTVNAWDEDGATVKNVWNQTEDLVLGAGTTFTVTDWGNGEFGSKLSGSWS